MVKQKMQQSENILTLKERLDFIMKLHGLLKPGQLAKKAGLQRQTLETAYNRNSMNASTAARLGERLHINPGWILFGTSSFLPSTEGDPAGLLITTALGKGPPSADDSAGRPQELPYYELYAYIPKAKSKISAGGGTFPEEDFEEKRYGFLRSWLDPVATAESNLFLIDIEGDSMEPTLRNGDTILIDRGRTDLVAGAIFAIRSDSVTLIKRIALLASGKVLIKSDNPIYPPEEVWAGEVSIIGQMIWSARTWI